MSIDLNSPPTPPAVAPNAAQKLRIIKALGLGTASTKTAEFFSAKERVARSLLLDSSPTVDALGVMPLDGDYAFYNVNYSIRNGAATVTGTSLPDIFTGHRLSLNVPFPLTEVAERAFDTANAQYSFTGPLRIPEGITSVGAYAFRNLSELTSLELPSSLTYIGSMAFNGCSGIIGIELPENLGAVGSGAFGYCAGAAGTLRLPQGLNTVYSGAFTGCTGFDTLAICGTNTTIASDAFYLCSFERLYAAQDPIYIPLSTSQVGRVFYKEGVEGWDQPPWDTVPSSVWTSYPDPMP